MKAALHPHRRRQFDLFSQALQWAKGDNMEQCKRSVKRALAVSPITEMQWWHLKMIVGAEALQNIRAAVGAQQEIQSVRG